MKPGLYANLSNEDYHSGPGISSSDIKLAKKALALYKAKLDGELPNKSTPAMALGTAVHTLVLERHKADDDLAVMPAFGRTKSGLAAKADWLAEHEGKTHITEEQHITALAMSESLLALPDVQRILEQGEPEQSGYWIDENGLLLKYRPDFRTDWCLFDVKTTRDLSSESFSRDINNFGYHISAAHYLQGDTTLTGSSHRQFVFGAVESAPPYLAACYVLDGESLELGRTICENTLRRIAEAQKSGVWPGYNAGLTREIGVPRWALG